MQKDLRRKDKAQPPEEIVRILEASKICTLAVITQDGQPYSVPMGFIYLDGEFYIHSALAGQKYEALLKNPQISFSVVEDTVQAPPGRFTLHYRSVIGFGRVVAVEDNGLVRKILWDFTQKYDPSVKKSTFDEYTKKLLGMTAVFRVEIDNITAKGNR